MALCGNTFVGRERELVELDGWFADAMLGNGRCVLIAGEPGIGKTRLAEELVASADSRGAQSCWGRSWAGGGAPPLWPWTQVLRALLTERDAQQIAANLGARVQDLAELLPDFESATPREPCPRDGTAYAALDPERMRFRLFDAVFALIREAAAARPLVLVFDDLHVADLSSLQLLRFVARFVRDAPVLMMGTYQEAEMNHDAARQNLIGELATDAERVLLRGWSRDEIGRFLARAVTAPSSTEPQKIVTSELVAMIHEATGGNPLFVDGIARVALAENGVHDHLPIWKARIPEHVREAVRRRLRKFREDGLPVLGLAAVVGREFDLSVLRAVCSGEGNVPLPDDELCGAATDELLNVLGEAVEHEVVEPLGAGRYRFAHDLFRYTLYEDMLPSRRAAWHRRIAEVLESLQRHHDVAAIAHHYLHAPGEVTAKALEYSLRAGDRAARALAYEDAVTHYDHATRLFEKLPAGAGREADEFRQCDALLAFGEALSGASERQRAQEIFTRAAELAKRLDSPSRLARAALGRSGGVRALTELGDHSGKIDLLEDALRAIGAGDAGLRAPLLGQLSIQLQFTGDVARRIAVSGEALALARRHTDGLPLAHVLLERHRAIWGPDSLQERLALTDELVALARTLSDEAVACGGHGWKFVDLLESGDAVAARCAFEVYCPVALASHDRSLRWGGLLTSAMWALLEGRYADGERLAFEALAEGQRAGTPAQIALGPQLFAMRRDQGRMWELEPFIRQLVEQHPHVAMLRANLLALRAELGEPASVRSHLDRVMRDGVATLPRDLFWMGTIACLADGCAYVEDSASAVELYALLRPYEEQHVVTIHGTAYFGAAARSLGVLASTAARFDEAERHFEAALRRHRVLGARPWVARTEVDYAAMRLRRASAGDGAAARELLDSAIAASEEMGASAIADRARRLLDQLNTRHPAVVEGAARGDAKVFRRDDEAWFIAFEGRTCVLKHSTGLVFLATLLSTPDAPWSAPALLRTSGRGAGAAAEASADGKDAERARVAVTRAIGGALKRIHTQHPALGQHLTASISTGRSCVYRPGSSVVWDVGDTSE